MTWSTDLARRNHSVGYYVLIGGIATRLGTHDFADYGLSGTYLPCLKTETIAGGESKLDKEHSAIITSGFSFSALDSATLRSIVRRRGGTETTLASAITKTATSLTLGSGTNTYANGTKIFVDKETITLGTHTVSGTYTGCTRGTDGCLAARHAAGAVISDVPRHWLGREVTLVLVHLETGTAQAIRWGSLSASPEFERGMWSFQAADRLGHLLNRPVFSGFAEVSVDSAVVQEDTGFTGYTGSVLVAQLTMADASQFADGYLRVSSGLGQHFFLLRGAEISTTTIKIAFSDLVGGDDIGSPQEFVNSDLTICQYGQVEATPGEAALSVMLSDLGDGANDSTYDVLGGIAVGAGTPPRRIGAAIPAAYVDAASWGEAGAGRTLRIPIDDPVILGDFLANEILWRSGGFVYLNSSGKIAFKRYTAGVRSAATTITDAEILSISSTDDEESTVSNVTIECNYDPATRNKRRTVDFVFDDNAAIYDTAGGRIALSCKHLWLGQPPYSAGGLVRRVVPLPSNFVEVQSYFDRIRYRMNVATRSFNVELPAMMWESVDEGDRVLLSSSYCIDHLGGSTLGSVVCEVVGRSIDYVTGNISVRLDEVDRGWLITPSARVDSWTAGSKTLALSTTGVLGAGTMFDADPGADFMADCYVRIFHGSAGYGTSERVQVASVTASTIVLKTTPSTAPAAHDIVVMDFSADTGNENAAGADVGDHAFMADSGLQVSDGTTDDDGPKYG